MVNMCTLILHLVLGSKKDSYVLKYLHLLLSALKLHWTQRINHILWKPIILLHFLDPLVHFMFFLSFTLYFRYLLLSSYIFYWSYFHSYSCCSTCWSRATACPSRSLIYSSYFVITLSFSLLRFWSSMSLFIAVDSLIY